MFEKIFGLLFVKNVRRNGCTLISAKREIKFSRTVKSDRALAAGTLKSRAPRYAVREDAFWDNRGKAYGAIFTSLNGRTF